MPKGTASWRYNSSTGIWYFDLDERAAPPYRTVVVEATLDLDADGRLAGIEIITGVRGSRPPIEPPIGVSSDEG